MSKNNSKLVPSVGYVRRSSDSESQEASISEQIKAIQQYAAERGYLIIRWYTDDAISGDDTKNRRDFLRMLADAREKRDFQAILCWDEARFGRFDSIEFGYYVYPLREVGVYLATVMDGVTNWNESTGRIVANVKQEGKHQQLLDHSANVARGQMNAAKAGSWIGSPPYAYRLEGPKKAKRLVLDDPDEANVVRRIFREYVEERRPMGNIAERLNTDGFVSPGAHPKGWMGDAVKVILENPAYVGDFVSGRYSYGKYHRIVEGKVDKVARNTGRIRNPESQWTVRRDNHEAIIDRETFDKAQALLAKHKTGRGPHTPDTNPYRLTGVLRCGRCGCPLWGMENRKWRYYECSHRKINGEDACEGTVVREDKILNDIADYLTNWLGLDTADWLEAGAECGALKPEDLPEAFEKIRKLVMPPSTPKVDRSRLEKQAEQLKGKVTKARANLVLLDAENIPAAQERIRQLEEQRAAIEEELKKSKPLAERDINAVVLAVLHNLYSLAYCCRVLARPVEEGWEVVGSLETIAPTMFRRFLNHASHIVCHTRKVGRGNGTRHVFDHGEIVFEGVGLTRRDSNPHRAG